MIDFPPALAVVRQVAQARRLPVILVGGAVRDALAGGAPAKDLDFAVQGNAIELGRAVADRLGGGFYILDAERGTARVLLKPPPAAPLLLDFATCRGATWDDDLLARDFTVNAIAIDLADGRILDPSGGRADLAGRIIRQAAPRAIAADPVRALRAVRMALLLGGGLEPATAAAARAAAGRLDQPSPERLRDELMKLLARSDAARGARWLDELGLLGAVLPEIDRLRGYAQPPPHRYDALEHTFIVLECADRLLAALPDDADPMAAGAATPGLAAWQLDVAGEHRRRLAQHLASVTSNDRLRAAVFRLSILLHDCGKPAALAGDPPRPLDHPAIGAGLAAARAAALRLSADEMRQVRLTVAHHMQPNLMARQGDTGPRALYRLARAAGDCLPELALLCVADGIGKAGDQTKMEDRQRRGGIASLLIDRYYTRFAPDAAPAPLIDGRDVLALGLPPGPRIGAILDAVREAQMAGEVDTRHQALRLAGTLAAAA